MFRPLNSGYLARRPDFLGGGRGKVLKKVKTINMSSEGVREENKRGQKKKRERAPY